MKRSLSVAIATILFFAVITALIILLWGFGPETKAYLIYGFIIGVLYVSFIFGKDTANKIGNFIAITLSAIVIISMLKTSYFVDFINPADKPVKFIFLSSFEAITVLILYDNMLSREKNNPKDSGQTTEKELITNSSEELLNKKSS